MPKMKTRKGAAKRFKITATGKILRRCSHQNHKMKQTDSTKQRLSLGDEVKGGFAKRTRRMLCIGVSR
jgi:large subunit ribosomal protein L35